MIFMLTAATGSGKTTSLIKWSEERNDVYGILTPVVDGKRMFMNAATKEQFPMEAGGSPASTGILQVGKFIFSKDAFEKAISIIRDAIDKKGWLIIDEIGPLELKGEGFHAVLKEVLAKRKEKMILVVREGLTDQVVTLFSVNGKSIKTTNDIL